MGNAAYWSYYRRRAVINTVACQTTGTVTFTYATRTVTLTGATFPTDVRYYRLIIGNTSYDIASYTDSTHIVLPETSNPGADVSSSTYTLYKSEYPLPTDFRRLVGLFDTLQRRLIEIISDSTDQMLQVAALWSPGVPLFAAIRNTGNYLDRISLVFAAAPVDARPYDLLYDARPRPFVIPEKYSDGTVSTSGTALTGSSTAFPSNCAGCVMRFSSNASDEPTGPFGSLVGNQNVDNPPAFSSQVLKYTSGTSLTLVDAPSTDFSGVKYTLSDPVDVEDGAMWTAFLRMAEAHYARMMNYENRTEREAAAQLALLVAKENDVRTLDKRQLPVVTQQWFTLSAKQG